MNQRTNGTGLAYRLSIAGAACLLASVGAIAAAAAVSGDGIRVSQKNRQFQPGALSLKRGDIARIVNDDGDLRHHAYIDSDTFSFDSGDQEPGRETAIRFTVTGDFKVLCGIHPKMKLLVHVE
jgi:plastocyanin